MVMVDRTMAALPPQGAVLGAQAVLAMTTATLHVAIGEYSFTSVLFLACAAFCGCIEIRLTLTDAPITYPISLPYTPWLPNVYS
jgi:hypothetical protein